MLSGNCFELQYTKKFPFIKISKKNLFAIFFIAVMVGVLAFFMETILDYIAMGYLYDRGFLIGPFIPVYFFCVLFGLLYIKTPKASLKNFFLYTFIIGGGISLVEFIVGNVCELLFKEVLWTYDGFMPLSYKYVSLTVGLIWGVLGTLLVMFIIPIIKYQVDNIPEKFYAPFVITFFVLFLSDVIATLFITKNNGWQYKELYQIKASTELTVFMIGILLYILLVIYFARFLYRSFEHYHKAILTIYIISILIPIFSLIDYFNRFNSPFLSFLSSLGFVILALYLYLVLSMMVIFPIKWLIYKVSKKEIFKSIRSRSYGLVLSLISTLIITLIGVVSVKVPKTTHLTVGTGEKTLNIVALSDIHYASTGSILHLEKMVQEINDLNPDIVFLVGDIIDNEIEKLDKDYFIDNINKIESKLGVFAVPGNHEYEYNGYYEVINFFKETNIDLLVDDYVIINNEIVVLGRLDYIYDDRARINEILDLDLSLPLIVLDHQPYEYEEAKDAGAILQLSGHTHNGQLFPANWIVQLYSSFVYHCDKVNGLYQENDFSLYVTKGYGTWGFPLRTTGRSEILQIDFKY